jgi:hypothetical protein
MHSRSGSNIEPELPKLFFEELSGALFLRLTVQPCGEPCGSARGFHFLTVGAILYIKYLVRPSVGDVLGAFSMAEPARERDN